MPSNMWCNKEKNLGCKEIDYESMNIYLRGLFYLFNCVFSFVLLVVLSLKWLSDHLASLEQSLQGSRVPISKL